MANQTQVPWWLKEPGLNVNQGAPGPGTNTGYQNTPPNPSPGNYQPPNGGDRGGTRNSPQGGDEYTRQQYGAGPGGDNQRRDSNGNPLPNQGEGNLYGGNGGNNTGQGTDTKTDPNADFETWYKNVIQANPDKYSTDVSKQQWQAWFPLFDSASGGFHSSKVDRNGNPIQGIMEHPDACPQGMQAFGQNQCREPGDISGGLPADQMGNNPANNAAPPKPLTLQDVLMNMFQGRTNMFAYTGGRDPNPKPFQGMFGVDQMGNALPNAPDLVGKALDSGGLIWGDKGLDLSQYGDQPKQATSLASSLNQGQNNNHSGWNTFPMDDNWKNLTGAGGATGGSVSNPVTQPLDFSQMPWSENNGLGNTLNGGVKTKKKPGSLAEALTV